MRLHDDKIQYLIAALFMLVILVYSMHKKPKTLKPDRPDTAVVQMQVVKPINDLHAVGLIMDMNPHRMPTIAGDAFVTRGSEIYFKAPDSLRRQLGIDAGTRGAVRCLRVAPDSSFGWKVIEVFTRYKCKNLHYEN